MEGLLYIFVMMCFLLGLMLKDGNVGLGCGIYHLQGDQCYHHQSRSLRGVGRCSFGVGKGQVADECRPLTPQWLEVFVWVLA